MRFKRMIDEERLKQIRERRADAARIAAKSGWLNSASWTDIDFLLSLLDSHTVDGDLSHCALCEDPSFIYRDCVIAAAANIRNKCVIHLRTTADALDVRQETECPSGTAFNSEAKLRRRIADEIESLDQVEQEKKQS